MTRQCPVCEKPNADTTTVRTVDLSGGGKPTVKDQDVCSDCAAKLIAQHITPVKAGRKDRKMKIPPLSQTREQITQGHVDNAVNYVLSRGDEEAEDALSSVTGLIRELRADRQALFDDRNNLSDALLEVIRISNDRPALLIDRLARVRQCAGSALDRSNGVAKAAVKALK